jgi:hypothetical protein
LHAGLAYRPAVLADGTRLVSTAKHRLLLLTPSGLLATFAGGNDDDDDDAALADVQGPAARFCDPAGRVTFGTAVGEIMVF